MDPIYDIVKGIPVDQVSDVWNLVVSGHYTDLFFDKFTPYIGKAIRNNLELLLIFAYLFQKLARLTKNTWDDKISNWFVNLVSKWRKPDITVKKENHKSKNFDDSKYH